MRPFRCGSRQSYSGILRLTLSRMQEIKMNLYRRILMLESRAVLSARAASAFARRLQRRRKFIPKAPMRTPKSKRLCRRRQRNTSASLSCLEQTGATTATCSIRLFIVQNLAPILSANYEVVHVDIGKGDKNQDLMRKYEVPMKRGIPGLAVLDADGKLVYSQKNGEFENARALAPGRFSGIPEQVETGAAEPVTSGYPDLTEKKRARLVAAPEGESQSSAS